MGDRRPSQWVNREALAQETAGIADVLHAQAIAQRRESGLEGALIPDTMLDAEGNAYDR